MNLPVLSIKTAKSESHVCVRVSVDLYHYDDLDYCYREEPWLARTLIIEDPHGWVYKADGVHGIRPKDEGDGRKVDVDFWCDAFGLLSPGLRMWA
jgi:hypothetical protein